MPIAAATLVVVSLVSNLLGAGITWFDQHQGARLVRRRRTVRRLALRAHVQPPDTRTPRARSPLEGLRRPRTGTGVDNGRTGAIPLLVLACAAVAAAIAAAVAVSWCCRPRTWAADRSRSACWCWRWTGVSSSASGRPPPLPPLSRRRLLSLAIAFTGIALLAAGLVPDVTTVLLIAGLAGIGAGVAANTGHALLDQETEEYRRARTTEHLHAVVRVSVALGALPAPVGLLAIGPHRLENGKFVFAHGGAAFTLMLVALPPPVAALVLAKVDDRSGVPLRHDLLDALRGGDDPVQKSTANGFFLALEGGDGAGESTQAERSRSGSAPRATRSW